MNRRNLVKYLTIIPFVGSIINTKQETIESSIDGILDDHELLYFKHPIELKIKYVNSEKYENRPDIDVRDGRYHVVPETLEVRYLDKSASLDDAVKYIAKNKNLHKSGFTIYIDQDGRIG